MAEDFISGVDVVKRGWRIWYANGKSYASWDHHQWNWLPEGGVAIVEWWAIAQNGKDYVQRDMGGEDYPARGFEGHTKQGGLMPDDEWRQLYRQVMRLPCPLSII
jgi:hypothetical protein